MSRGIGRSVLALAIGGCLLFSGCTESSPKWNYNSCGDPRSVEVTPSPVGGAIGVETLLDEMADLDGIAHRAPRPYRTCMVSSYDRESKIATSSSATATGWYANHDWGNYLGAENGPSGASELVLLDTDGPGSIVRIWSATPSGTLRIYVDQASTIALEASMTDLLSGHVEPLVPPFAGITASGSNMDFPIPFRKHVKVTWEGAGGFYQIVYRRYVDATTEVESFELAGLDAGKLDSVRAQLREPALPKSGVVSLFAGANDDGLSFGRGDPGPANRPQPSRFCQPSWQRSFSGLRRPGNREGATR